MHDAYTLPLLQYFLTWKLKYQVVKGNRLSRPLNDSEIGSRMEYSDEVRCRGLLWIFLLYPYSNALNLNK